MAIRTTTNNSYNTIQVEVIKRYGDNKTPNNWIDLELIPGTGMVSVSTPSGRLSDLTPANIDTMIEFLTNAKLGIE